MSSKKADARDQQQGAIEVNLLTDYRVAIIGLVDPSIAQRIACCAPISSPATCSPTNSRSSSTSEDREARV